MVDVVGVLQSLRDGVNPPMIAMLNAALNAAAAERGVAGRNWNLATHALLAVWLRIGMQFLFGEGISRSASVTAAALTRCIEPAIARRS